MPIYEYRCPEHGKFEILKGIGGRVSNPCPQCNNVCGLIPSRFTHYWFNAMTVDGPGFSSEYHRPEEIEEMNKELRER